MWHVVDGTAWTFVDGVERTLRPGERLLVGVGSMHRLGNPGATPLRVLEIAFGHFDEADIERFDDDHARPTA
jgi:mannose-1-phosphate guanylyltransferase/mannose-6-phosphate isomerase